MRLTPAAAPAVRSGIDAAAAISVVESPGPESGHSPHGGDSPFELGLLLRRAHDIAAGQLAEVLVPFGLGLRHFAVMIALTEHGPMSQRQLVIALGKDGSSMVRVVDDLEQAGLAERRSVPTDRRRNSVELTEAGVRTYEKAHRDAVPVADVLAGRLGSGQATDLVRLLRDFCGPAHGASPAATSAVPF